MKTSVTDWLIQKTKSHETSTSRFYVLLRAWWYDFPISRFSTMQKALFAKLITIAWIISRRMKQSKILRGCCWVLPILKKPFAVLLDNTQPRVKVRIVFVLFCLPIVTHYVINSDSFAIYCIYVLWSSLSKLCCVTSLAYDLILILDRFELFFIGAV